MAGKNLASITHLTTDLSTLGIFSQNAYQGHSATHIDCPHGQIVINNYAKYWPGKNPVRPSILKKWIVTLQWTQ